MNILERVERWLEGRIEGLFRLRTGGGVQPVEIGRRLVREMEVSRRVSVNRVYVPNAYHVRLSPPDFESLSAFGAALSSELERHLISRAQRQDYLVTGRLEVLLVSDAAQALGHFQVQARFTATPEAPSPEPRSEAGDTVVFRARRAAAVGESPPKEPPRRVEENEPGLRLEATTGPEAGRLLFVPLGESTVGRGEANRVVVNDPNVSRVHASLTVENGRVQVRDLDSRNGTYVNGRRVAEAELRDGDELRVGMTVLRVRGT